MRQAASAWLAVACWLVVGGTFAGCGGGRIHVTDATSGAPVGGARIVLEDGAGVRLDSTRTSSSGRASLPLGRHGTLLHVTARGYRSAELSAATSEDPIEIGLQPAWMSEFLDSGTHPPVEDPAEQLEVVTPSICPCRR